MKKLSTLLLALIATTALWAADFTVDGIAYNILGGDSVEVTSKSPDYSGAITIPASVTYESTTYRVTGIEEDAFSDCTSLTSIAIPNSVTSIGNEAFRYCDSLISINVDAGNTHYASVDGVLFSYAKDTIIQYPKGNKRTTYTIPNSVTNIGWYAFYDCTSLTSITIPNSVNSIGRYAFCKCTSLISIAIPNSVTSIGNEAFRFCTSLISITVDAGNTHYTSVDGVLFSYAKDTIIQYPMGNTCTTYTIPNSVTSIGVATFSNCTSLTSITIPNSVASIGEQAFRYCTSLISINVDPANTHFTSIEGVLFNYAKVTLIQYPVGNTRKEYTIPSSVAYIGEGAFAYCHTLSTVTIPNSVSSIGEDAFMWCTFSSITIGSSVTSIGIFAFYGFTSLTSITCYATTPPTCGIYCFGKVDKSIPLYVPSGSVQAYKAAYDWKEFTNIQAIATALPQLPDSEFRIQNSKFLHNGHLIIQTPQGHLYTPTGNKLQ